MAETTDHHFFVYLVFYVTVAWVILNLYLSFLSNHDMTYSSVAWLGLWNLGLDLNCAFDPPKIIMEQILCHLLPDGLKIILLIICGKKLFFSRIIVARQNYLSQSSRKSLTILATASNPKAALNIFMGPVSTK